jgi:hypothetical protein
VEEDRPQDASRKVVVALVCTQSHEYSTPQTKPTGSRKNGEKLREWK